MKRIIISLNILIDIHGNHVQGVTKLAPQSICHGFKECILLHWTFSSDFKET